MAVPLQVQCSVRMRGGSHPILGALGAAGRLCLRNHSSCREDMYAPESLDLLQKSGIDLTRHEEMGIEPNDFAELMITSGLVLSPDTKWISFHR